MSSSSARASPGLAAAIRLKQLADEEGREISVCVLEKGSEVGAHILSGAVIDPKALDELIPDWKDKDSPLTVPVTDNHHWVLTEEAQVCDPARRSCRRSCTMRGPTRPASAI